MPRSVTSCPDNAVISSGAPQRAVEKSLVDWSQLARQNRAERDFSTALEMTAPLGRSRFERAALVRTHLVEWCAYDDCPVGSGGSIERQWWGRIIRHEELHLGR